MKITLERGNLTPTRKYPYLARYCGSNVTYDGLVVVIFSYNEFLIVESGDTHFIEGNINNLAAILSEGDFLKIPGKVTLEF